MKKQYMALKVGSRYITVFRIVDGIIEGYTEISERDFAGFTKALEEVGYEVAYYLTEYERLYTIAMQEAARAKEAYYRAKENQLVLDDAEAQKFQTIVKRLDYVELPL